MAHLATAGYHLQPRGTSSSRTGMLQSPVICRPSVPSSITCRRAFSNIRATSAVAEATTVEGPKRRRRRAPVSSQPDSSDTPTLGISEAGPSTDGDRSPATGTVTVTAAATAWVGSRANNNNNSASSATTDAADVHTRNSPRDNASVAPPHASSQQRPSQSAEPSEAATTAQLQQIEYATTLSDLRHVAATFSQQTSPAVLALAIKRCLKVPAEDGQQVTVVAQLLERLWQLQQAQLQDCSAGDLALMVRALCRAPHGLQKQYRPAVIKHLVPQFLQLLPTASAKDIAIVLHALSTAKLVLSAADMQAVITAFIAVLHDAMPQSVCLVLWGAGSMHFQIHTQQMQRILGTFQQMLPAPNAVNFAQAALGKLGLGMQAASLRAQLQTTERLMSQKPDPASLTQLICHCRHAAGLLRIAAEHSTSLSPLQIAEAMQQVVKLSRRVTNCHHTVTDEAFDRLWMQQQAQLGSCDSSIIPTMIKTFLLAPNSIKQRHPGAISQHLMPALLQQLPSATADTVAQVLVILAEYAASRPEEPMAEITDLCDAVPLLVQQFLACHRQANGLGVANVYHSVVQLRVQLQQDQLQQLIDTFVQKDPSVRAEKRFAEAMIRSGLEEEVKRVQETLGQLRGPEWLSSIIKSAPEVEVLQWLLDNHRAVFDQTHIAAAIARAVKLHHEKKHGKKEQEKLLQRLLNQLWHLQEPQLQSCCTGILPRMIRSFCFGPAVIQRQFWPVVTQQLVPAILQKQDQQQPGACAAAAYAAVTAAEQQQLQLDIQQVRQLLDVVSLKWKWQYLNAEGLAQVLWASSKIDYSIPSQVVQQQVDRALQCLMDAAPAAERLGPSATARLLWSLAVRGHQLPRQQTHQLLYLYYKARKFMHANTVARVLWAVARMGEKPSLAQVQQLLTAFVNRLQSASFAAVADVAWACGEFGYLRKDYLSRSIVLEAIPTAPAQQIAQLARACGELAYCCKPLMHAVMQRIMQLQQDSPVQALVNISWACAVLDLQQYATQVVQLVGVVSQHWGTGPQVTGHDTTLVQLYQVHLWLQDSQSAGGQGLLCALTPQQLRECQEEHRIALNAAAVNAEPWLLLSVFVAVQQLPLMWQEHPQFQQYSRDGAVLLDISAKTAQGTQLALFVDEAESFSQPDGLPMGKLLFRDRLLIARGYQVVSISTEHWRQLEGQQEEQQQYLLQLLAPCPGQGSSTSELPQQKGLPAQQPVEQSYPCHTDPGQTMSAGGSTVASRVLHTTRQVITRRLQRSAVNKG